MISVNDLIQTAYTRTGLVGDGQSVNGTRAKTALIELNALIQELNLQEYLADNVKSFEVSANGKIVIADDEDADIVLKELPSHIKSVGRKIGNRFVPLYTSNIERMMMNNRQGKASMYTYNVDFDEELEKMKGVITLDTNSSDTYMVVLTDSIPKYNLTDKIRLQDMYEGLLIAGLSYKLAIRYKVQDWVGTFKDEFDSQKSLIKRINQTNRNMTWIDTDSGSYSDSYYDGIAGKGW